MSGKCDVYIIYFILRNTNIILFYLYVKSILKTQIDKQNIYHYDVCKHCKFFHVNMVRDST